MRSAVWLLFLVSISAAFGLALGQPADPDIPVDPAAIVEIGGAPGWSVTGGGFSFSPTVAAEITPIENWLELEMGVTPIFSRHSTEWDTDLLFKKPWLVKKGGVYVRRRSGVGSYAEIRHRYEFSR